MRTQSKASRRKSPGVCRNCPHWAISKRDTRFGQCRRLGPARGQQPWPQTRSQDWCGWHPERRGGAS